MNPRDPEARDGVAAWIENPDNISEQQRAAVVHEGDLFLAACPGAGKTRTVGVRLAWGSVTPVAVGRAERRRRTAALSYTNIAVDEIAGAAELAGAPVTEPDFLGTIHRFLLRYVVRPFAMQPMGCTEPPRLVTETRARQDYVTFRDRFVNRQVSVWDLHFRSDGTLSLAADADVLYETQLDADTLAARVQADGQQLKRKLAAEGLLSMSDAMYWAQQALEVDEHARSVAARFDELIVDEAQDTTETQLRSLRLLKRAGLRSLVLIGDPDQAIYGFAGAEPAALEQLAADLNLDRRDLTENWRSSQLICNAAARFRTRAGADEAVSERRDSPYHPELIVYDADDPRSAVDHFTRRLDELAIDAPRIAVLSRGRGTRDALNGTGGGVFKGRLADLAELAAAAQDNHTIGKSGVQDVEADIARHAWPDLTDDDLDDVRRFRLRAAVFDLASRLPELQKTSTEWCRDTRAAVNATIDELKDSQGGDTTRYTASAPRGTGSYPVADLLAGRRGAVRVRTVHAVKGESYDATLTVAVETERFNNARDWLTTTGEERRVAYVALTRAKTYCAVAVPDCCHEGLIAEFEDRGFRRLS